MKVPNISIEFGSFNQLDLPDYESKEVLSERLLIAIREGKEFGFM